MDEERNPPPFFPLRTQTRSACQPPALLSGLPAPPSPRSRTIGQTDGRTDGASARAGRAGGDPGVSAGCPLPAARPGTPSAAPDEAVWGFFSFSRPSPSAGVALAGWTPMGVGEALTPTRLWQRHQRGSETPPSPATAPPALRPPPIPAAGAERRGEERRGPPPEGTPPLPPPLRPRPPPRPWRRRRVLSLLPARSRGTL